MITQTGTESELIYRQQAIDALTEYGNGRTVYIGVEEAVRRIEQLPPIQPIQPKRGKWRWTYLNHESMGVRPKVLYCSECNQCIAYPTNFCPNCGSDMREVTT